MLKLHYPELFRGHPAEKEAITLARRVYELTEFLVQVLQVKLTDLGPPTRVVLHTSCSARREMGVTDSHQALLAQLGQVETVEPERATECCGFGGTFSIKHPEVSAAMVEEKAGALFATGAERLVTGDCGCLMNISGHLQQRGDALAGEHIATFLWERTSDE
jgi:L-lactate dehydrogenase complex protein LldE